MKSVSLEAQKYLTFCFNKIKKIGWDYLKNFPNQIYLVFILLAVHSQGFNIKIFPLMHTVINFKNISSNGILFSLAFAAFVMCNTFWIRGTSKTLQDLLVSPKITKKILKHFLLIGILFTASSLESLTWNFFGL